MLPAGVGADLGRQASQKPFEGLGPVAFQEELVFELVYDPLDDRACPKPTAFPRRPTPSWSSPSGSAATKAPYPESRVSLPLNRGEALLGEV